jgi:lipopolysaccharide export system protein LptC
MFAASLRHGSARAAQAIPEAILTAESMTADGEIGGLETRARDERRRADAFAAAARHSRRVRLIRVAILSSVAAGLLGLAGALFLGGRKQPEGLSLGSIGVEGSRVTMSLPKLTGFRSDLRPYEVTARAATQDLKTPTLIELQDLDARIGMGERGTGHVTSRTGRYDNVKETLRLEQDVVMRTDRGYELRLSEGDIDFKSGTLVSDKPVEGVMNASSVRADRLRVTEGGRRLLFEGRVRTRLKSDTPAAPAAQPKAAAK